MKTRCYYHKIDFDGKCSAAIVRRKYPDCELIGVDYPDRPDFETIAIGATVFVVDFSFVPNDMEMLFKHYKLRWIDHHKSALEKTKYWPNGSYKEASGKRDIGKAACELTWEYLFPDEPTPEAVRLLGRYDIFDKSDMEYWENEILPFQYGMRQKGWWPHDPLWIKLFTDEIFIYEIAQMGGTILAYENQRNATYAEKLAFPVEFEGHKAWAINKALSNSEIFETLPNANERPLWILFSYRAGIWKYSLYSASDSGIDVPKIALLYGGGGHAGAAGFQSEKYLLKK